MIDFSLPSELVELRDRVRQFIVEKIVPLEHDARQTPHGPTEEMRLEMIAMARKAGLL